MPYFTSRRDVGAIMSARMLRRAMGTGPRCELSNVAVIGKVEPAVPVA